MIVAEAQSPVSSYLSAAAAPGTIDYYVLLFSNRPDKSALGAGLAIGNVIMNIAHQVSDPQMCRLKLHWWLEEIDLTRVGKPRHPLTTALAEKSTTEAWLPPLQLLVNGALNHAGVSPFTSLAQLLPFCHYAAQRQALLASIQPDADAQGLEAARNAGVGIILTQLLCSADSRLPLNGFADETNADQDKHATALQLLPIAHKHFEACHPGDTQKQPLRAIMLQAALHRQMLVRLADNDFAPQRATLSPINLLWHAWREARKLHT